ncbi:oncostatin-M-specific receptor subunit beta isoform X2 [Rhinatrema bivittatum]|uniref:oncostatin-M-specific receptor subunit beta isoform X2 n=1 Tax=Rhinatrema bivittatum TaxID=194408 RepID=UPI0011298754|nr:oncostatin-M-specific receptor subunit beta isoform X2 [Rhinatrema bivittatum]
MDPLMVLQTTILLLILDPKVSRSEEPLVVPPLHLKVSNDSFQQRLFLEWNVSDWAYESELKMLFQIQVSQTEKRDIIWTGNYSKMLSKLDKVLRWMWDSNLPLQCSSHSVRIRSAVDDPRFPAAAVWSDWTPWQTVLGLDTSDSKEPSVFPKNKVVKKGSNITFCCVAGKGQHILSVEYNGSSYPLSYVSNRSVAITLRDVALSSASGRIVFCSLSEKKNGGTVFFVGKSPEKPTNLSCETQDLKTLICTWSPGEASNLFGVRSTKYSLSEWFSQHRKNCSRDRCFWPIDKNQHLYNFSLRAWNDLGETDAALVLNVTHKVCPRTPTDLSADHLSATNVILYWTMKSNYAILILHCQTEVHKVKNGEMEVHNVSMKGFPLMSQYSINIDQLQPYTAYTLRVRCGAAEHFWKWSNWSENLSIRTREAAPTVGLDIWREVKQQNDNRTVIIYWKPLSEFEANGEIISHNVTWKRLEGTNVPWYKRVPASANSTEVSIDRQPYVIIVTARNVVGTSPASEIRIAKFQENDIKGIREERVNGTGDGIHVSWKPDKGEVHGYIVQWCNFPRSMYCDFQWKKYQNTTFSDVIKSAAFQPGVRYNFQIYTSKADGAHLLEKKTGYTKELAPAIKPAVKVVGIKHNAVSVTWDGYPTDDSQSGFISAYAIYVKIIHEECNLKGSEILELSDGSIVCKFTIGNPEVKTHTLDQLKPNTKYALSVVALTVGGEGAIDFSTQADTSYDSQAVLLAVLLPLTMCALLLLIPLMVCYWKRKWLKDTCFPEIPDPNKSNILKLDELKVNSELTILKVGNCITSTVEVVNISKENEPQLCKPGSPVMGREVSSHATHEFLNHEAPRFVNKPTWINFIQNEEEISIFPNPCTSFDNLTYSSQMLFGANPFSSLFTETSHQNASNLLYQQQPYLELSCKDSCHTSNDMTCEGTSSTYRSQMATPNFGSMLNDLPVCINTVECLGYKAQTNFSLGLLSTITSEDNIPTERVSVSPVSTNSTAFLLPD